MELRETWEKQLCMSALRVTHARYEKEHHCDAGGGADCARLVLAVKGCADIRAQGFHLHIDCEEGGLFYIPEGAQYHIIWTGSPDIEDYIFGIMAQPLHTENTLRYDIQHIVGVDSARAVQYAEEITSYFAAGDAPSRVRAIGVYYAFYAEVLPHLRPISEKRTNAALIAAIDYIETHYAEDFSMDTLAAAVCISESRLFHLFREALSTTPVKYRCAVRIRCAAADLRADTFSLEEIAVRCGFHSAAYLREMFKREVGLTPGEYREMNRPVKRES